MRILVTVVSGAMFLCGCQKPASPSTPMPELGAAPTEVVISGQRLLLETSLWRDFMPITPPDGKPLAGVLRVRTDDGSIVPADVRVESAWILHGTDVWSAVPREERGRSETAPAYEVIVRDGPKWGPNVDVDVVIRLIGGDGRRVLLSARRQTIGAAY